LVGVVHWVHRIDEREAARLRTGDAADRCSIVAAACEAANRLVS
jgi:hypothetical protein